jgi:hypothetical protein
VAIILADGRPAIDIVQDGYTRPDGEWAFLGDPEPRTRLEHAIRAVGRLDLPEHPEFGFLGTAFVVGDGLILTSIDMDEPMAVDFGQEILRRSAPWVRIEEILQRGSGFSLLRADLPDEVTQLELAGEAPPDLDGRAVVVIGYPGKDDRNDPEAMNRVFRSTFDVKRAMPGRIDGVDTDGAFPGALRHDCSTLGGTGSAPLIDVETGGVIGLHFAGISQEANFAYPTWSLAERVQLVEAGVRFSSTGSDSVAVPVAEPITVGEIERLVLTTGSAPPTEDELAEVEEQLEMAGIVVRFSRPALLVDAGRITPSAPWEDAIQTSLPHIELAIRATGIVLDPAESTPIGTAFVVGDGLIMTADYVVAGFIDGGGAAARLKDLDLEIDFSHGLGQTPGSAKTRVRRVRFMHPHFSVAVLEADPIPRGVAMLSLASQIPAALSGRKVSLISLAMHDPSRPQETLLAYENGWGNLYVQLGLAISVSTEAARPSALIHDCTTAAGSAGGPLIDLGTGHVLGVHVLRSTGSGGTAHPAWELARDPVVWDQGLRFQPDPRPTWLDSWQDAVPAAVAEPVLPTVATEPVGWTVDEIPIDWGREEPKEMERLLVGTIDISMGMQLAENSGLRSGTVPTQGVRSEVAWRLLIKELATAGLLRSLLQQIIEDRQYAGVAVRLKKYL